MLKYLIKTFTRCATRMQLLAAGVPLMEVSRRLVHSKPSHTLDLYGHAIPGHDQEVAKQIGTIYNLNPNKKPKKISRKPGRKIKIAGS